MESLPEINNDTCTKNKILVKKFLSQSNFLRERIYYKFIGSCEVAKPEKLRDSTYANWITRKNERLLVSASI